jgi:hypothetical protein
VGAFAQTCDSILLISSVKNFDLALTVEATNPATEWLVIAKLYFSSMPAR